MRVDCELNECHEHIEISDVLDKENHQEFVQALVELNDAGWGWDAGDKAHDIKFYCPDHKKDTIDEIINILETKLDE